MSEALTFGLVFGEMSASAPAWMRAFIPRRQRKAFGHVMVLAPLGPDRTLLLDPWASSVSLKCWDLSLDEVVRGFREHRHHVLVTTGVPESVFHLANMVPSCVTMAKYILGRRSWELTPYQLYRGLIREGAQR